MSIIKNTAGQYLYATLTSVVDGSAITTGAALYLAKDGAAQAAATGTLTHKGNGQWECALSQADTNANAIGYSWAGTNVVPQGGHIQTVDYPRTAIPAAAAGANDGLPKLSSAGAKLDYAIGAAQNFNNSGQTTKVPGAIAAGDIAANAIDAASVKADAVSKIQSGLVVATQMPANFAALLINSSGHVSRVTLTDTTTTNTDMRGTDNAAPAATALSNVVWTNAKAGYLDVAIGTRSTLAAGAAMTLTSGERDAVATAVESHLLDEGDSQMLINAIVGAIGNTNIDETVLVAAIRADLERTGGNLNVLLARLTSGRASALDNLDAAITSRQAAFSYTAPPSAATVAGAVRTEIAVELGRLDAAVTTRQATLTLPAHFSDLLISADGKVTVGTLPSPAPDGYGGEFSGDISGLTEEQAAQLAAIFARTSAGQVNFIAPLNAGGTVLRILQGDDYFASEGRSLDFASDDWPVLTPGAVKLKIGTVNFDGVISAPRSVRFELTDEQTTTIPTTPPAKFFEVEATLANGHVITLVRGVAIITADL